MKAHIAKRISGGLAAAASIFIFADGEAAYMPFNPTPNGFLRFANSQASDGATQYEFSNPRGCYMSGPIYRCTFDYRERSILGERACRGVRIDYSSYENKFGFSDPLTKPECSEWAPVTDSASDNKNPIDYKIALTLLAGGLLGALLAYALRDKKK